METAGIVLAIPGVVDLCLKYGQLVCKKYETFRDADELFRTRLLALEGRWLQIEAQIDMLKQLWHKLPARLQIHFTHVLAWLQTLLNRAICLTADLVATNKSSNAPVKFNILDVPAILKLEGKLKRGAFVLNQRDALDRLIAELGQWHQDMLGPSWFQLLRAPSTLIDEYPDQKLHVPQIVQLKRLGKNVGRANDLNRSLGTNMVLPENAIEAQITHIFGSTVQLCTIRTSQKAAVYDPIYLPDTVDKQATIASFSQLATKLCAIESSTLNLPECFGISTAGRERGIERPVGMVFHMPQDASHPRSLRELLMERNEFFPLQLRIELVIQLARSIVSIHSIGIVHKNIRPETILIFARDTSSLENEPSHEPSELNVLPFGFEQFRNVEAGSLRRGDMDWRRALYRHPNRHGLHPEHEYIMQHDIYSLGVCLLEIGLWMSFILTPEGHGKPHPDFDVSLIPGKETQRKAHVLKERMQQIAHTRLPGRMGTKYAEVVSTCLGCLDGRNVDFGNEKIYEEEDGDIRVSIRFMETVMLQLQEISI